MRKIRKSPKMNISSLVLFEGELHVLRKKLKGTGQYILEYLKNRTWLKVNMEEVSLYWLQRGMVINFKGQEDCDVEGWAEDTGGIRFAIRLNKVLHWEHNIELEKKYLK